MKIKGIFNFFWEQSAIFKKYTPKAGDKSDVVVSVKGDDSSIVDNINAVSRAIGYKHDEAYTRRNGLDTNEYLRVNDYRLDVFYNVGNLMDQLQLLVIALVVLITVVSSYGLINFSITDKRKQFGILRCIGASPGQIRALIYKEVFMLGIKAILPAIIVGHVISYSLIKYLQGKMIFNSYGADFGISIWGIIIVLGISLLTILLASIMPAIKAGKVTPIESTKTITSKQKSQKIGRVSKFIRKRFGIETEIAYRNLKANKSMFYVSTILLVVCFISFVTLSFVTDNYVSSFDSGARSKYDYMININTELDSEITNNEGHRYEKQLEGKSKEQIRAFTKEKTEEFVKVIEKNKSDIKMFLSNYVEGEIGLDNNHAASIGSVLFTGLSLEREHKLDDYFIEKMDENEYLTSAQILVYNEDYFNKMKEYIRGDFTYDEFKEEGVILVDNVIYGLTSRITKLFDNKKGDKISMSFKIFDNMNENIYLEDEQKKDFKNNVDQKIDMTVMGSIKLTDNMMWSGNISEGVAMIVSEEFFEKYAAKMMASNFSYFWNYDTLHFNLKKGIDPDVVKNILINKFNKDNELNTYFWNNIEERKAILELEKIIKVVLYGFLTMVISILLMSVLLNKKMSIEARRKEYGGLLAIGMEREKISKTIFYEGLIQAIIVFIIAIPLTVLINKIMIYLMDAIVTLEPANVWLYVIGVIAIIIVTIITSLLPLKMFKKLDIVTMIKGEE
ncbi:MAG: FtsX-like permease family protein [Sarcina sp.]